MTGGEQTVMVVVAVGEAIRDLGSVPSGHLYANLMGKLSFSQYQAIIDVLKRGKLVTETNHLLTWVGPGGPGGGGEVEGPVMKKI